jgi:hypothetical protein
MDVFTMMESGVTTILMDTTMATSLESVESHMSFSLFYYIYSSLIFKKSNDFHYATTLSFPSKKQTIFFDQMFLPPTSIFDPTIYPFTDKPYPPPILVKHPTWFFPDADLFISLDRVLYGVHQFYFDQSLFFQEIVHYGEADEIGVTPLCPIPFDTLKKDILNNFLYLLYFGNKRLGHLHQEDWINVKHLSMDWHFPHLIALIIRQFINY